VDIPTTELDVFPQYNPGRGSVKEQGTKSQDRNTPQQNIKSWGKKVVLEKRFLMYRAF
jgi:hypothetical protein